MQIVIGVLDSFLYAEIKIDRLARYFFQLHPFVYPDLSLPPSLPSPPPQKNPPFIQYNKCDIKNEKYDNILSNCFLNILNVI